MYIYICPSIWTRAHYYLCTYPPMSMSPFCDLLSFYWLASYLYYWYRLLLLLLLLLRVHPIYRICVCVCIYVCVWVGGWVGVWVCVRACGRAHVCLRTCMRVRVCVRECVCERVGVGGSVCVLIYISMCVSYRWPLCLAGSGWEGWLSRPSIYMHAHICIHIYV